MSDLNRAAIKAGRYASGFNGESGLLGFIDKSVPSYANQASSIIVARETRYNTEAQKAAKLLSDEINANDESIMKRTADPSKFADAYREKKKQIFSEDYLISKGYSAEASRRALKYNRENIESVADFNHNERENTMNRAFILNDQKEYADMVTMDYSKSVKEQYSEIKKHEDEGGALAIGDPSGNSSIAKASNMGVLTSHIIDQDNQYINSLAGTVGFNGRTLSLIIKEKSKKLKEDLVSIYGEEYREQVSSHVDALMQQRLQNARTSLAINESATKEDAEQRASDAIENMKLAKYSQKGIAPWSNEANSILTIGDLDAAFSDAGLMTITTDEYGMKKIEFETRFASDEYMKYAKSITGIDLEKQQSVAQEYVRNLESSLAFEIMTNKKTYNEAMSEYVKLKNEALYSNGNYFNTNGAYDEGNDTAGATFWDASARRYAEAYVTSFETKEEFVEEMKKYYEFDPFGINKVDNQGTKFRDNYELYTKYLNNVWANRPVSETQEEEPIRKMTDRLFAVPFSDYYARLSLGFLHDGNEYDYKAEAEKQISDMGLDDETDEGGIYRQKIYSAAEERKRNYQINLGNDLYDSLVDGNGFTSILNRIDSSGNYGTYESDSVRTYKYTDGLTGAKYDDIDMFKRATVQSATSADSSESSYRTKYEPLVEEVCSRLNITDPIVKTELAKHISADFETRLSGYADVAYKQAESLAYSPDYTQEQKIQKLNSYYINFLSNAQYQTIYDKINGSLSKYAQPYKTLCEIIMADADINMKKGQTKQDYLMEVLGVSSLDGANEARLISAIASFGERRELDRKSLEEFANTLKTQYKMADYAQASDRWIQYGLYGFTGNLYFDESANAEFMTKSEEYKHFVAGEYLPFSATGYEMQDMKKWLGGNPAEMSYNNALDQATRIITKNENEKYDKKASNASIVRKLVDMACYEKLVTESIAYQISDGIDFVNGTPTEGTTDKLDVNSTFASGGDWVEVRIKGVGAGVMRSDGLVAFPSKFGYNSSVDGFTIFMTDGSTYTKWQSDKEGIPINIPDPSMTYSWEVNKSDRGELGAVLAEELPDGMIMVSRYSDSSKEKLLTVEKLTRREYEDRSKKDGMLPNRNAGRAIIMDDFKDNVIRLKETFARKQKENY